MRIAYHIARVIAAVILLQTLYFKFTGDEESVYIFEKVGAEPVGRIGSGVVELVAAILLFVPSLSWLGALLALGVISGAIISHLTVLGVVVQGDGDRSSFRPRLCRFCMLPLRSLGGTAPASHDRESAT